MTRKVEKSGPTPPENVPATFKSFIGKFPALGNAHENIARAVDAAGPVEPKTRELIKMGICMGAGLESAFRSHVRRAIAHGATPSEIEQTVLMAMNTVGFPRTVAAWQWALQQMQRDSAEGG